MHDMHTILGTHIHRASYILVFLKLIFFKSEGEHSCLLHSLRIKTITPYLRKSNLLLYFLCHLYTAILTDALDDVQALERFVRNFTRCGVIKQLVSCMKNGINNCKDKAFLLAAVVSLGISAALALNIFVELLSVQSEKYDNVEAIQYSVSLWLGLILYGLVSPITEEIIFRGITYNRMKRFFGVVPCVIVTSLLFGGFHANMPQFLYGTCMGVLMALVYEWVKAFAAPLLLHMAANIIVFVLSFVVGDTFVINWLMGGSLAAISMVLLG